MFRVIWLHKVFIWMHLSVHLHDEKVWVSLNSQCYLVLNSLSSHRNLPSDDVTLATRERQTVKSHKQNFQLPTTMKLDPAVIDILSLDPSRTIVSSASGGCSSASTFKITTTLEDGTQKHFFMKTGSGNDAKIMFKGKLICRIVPLYLEWYFWHHLSRWRCLTQSTSWCCALALSKVFQLGSIHLFELNFLPSYWLSWSLCPFFILKVNQYQVACRKVGHTSHNSSSCSWRSFNADVWVSGHDMLWWYSSGQLVQGRLGGLLRK